MTEAVGGGTDTVQTTLSSYTLGANVENLTFTGTGNFAGTGNALNNVILGGAGTDTAMFDGTAWASTALLRGTLAAPTFTVSTATGGTDTLTSIEKVQFGTDTYNLVLGSGNNNADTLVGGLGNNYMVGGRGNDTITGGAGDDVIVWSAGDGRDVVDGGAPVSGSLPPGSRGDTFVINGNTDSEYFDIYSRAAWISAAGNASAQATRTSLLNISTEIVVTRSLTNGAPGNSQVIGELRNIEEIQVNTGGAATGIGLPTGTDHINLHGNFTNSHLNYNTITVDDQGLGAVTVDVTDMTSAHHIKLVSTNSTDVIIGQRPQDEIVHNGAPASGTGDNSGTAGSGSTGGSSGTGGDGSTGGSSGTTDTTTPAAPVDHAVNLNGDDTSNVLTAGNMDNTVAGHGGDDLVSVGNGNNILSGGAGDDTIVAGNGNNHVDGGAGNDDIFLGNGTNWVNAGAGDDSVFGGTGHTTFVDSGSDGNDSYYGRGASDTLDMSAITANIQANLGTGYAGWAKVGTEVNHLYGIANIITGMGDDTVTASDAHNTIDVGDHSATGHDTVIFRTATSADGDNILNFQAGDKIDLHGMMNGTVNLLPNGTAAANHDIAVHFDASTHGDSIVTGIDEGGNHFTLDVKGHHVIGTDFAA